MKIRNGFVTNSSSSSFICDVCNNVESGYDMTLSEAEMYECEQGHTFCQYHSDFTKNDVVIYKLPQLLKDAINNNYTEEITTFINILNNINDVDEDEIFEIFDNNDLCSNIPQKFCPICNLSSINDDKLKQYLLHKIKTSEKDIINEIQSNFKTLSEFEKFLKEEN